MTKSYITTSYYSASGRSHDDCYYISNRYNDDWGYKPFDAECWVVSHHALPKEYTGMRIHWGTTAFLTDLWTSPSGALFICNSTNARILYIANPLGKGSTFTEMQLKSISGVWGLDDQFVLTWGTSWGGKNNMHRFNGKAWKEFSAPKFQVTAVHGVNENFLCAVGRGGFAFWNGKTWKNNTIPDQTFLSVFITEKMEIYATTATGALLKYSGKTWNSIGDDSNNFFPYLDVVEWQGDVWVAGGTRGLFKYEQKKNKLRCVKPNLNAVNLDARGELLVTCKNYIASTKNGKNFFASGEDYILESRKKKELCDLS